MDRTDLGGTDGRMPGWRSLQRLRAPCLAAALAALTAGCAGMMDTIAPSAPAPSPSIASAPPAFPVETLVGNWGVASFRDEKDRKRTENMARAQCKLPYRIVRGPTDGVMMHVADDTQLYELTLKGTRDGRTFLGFNAPPGQYPLRDLHLYSLQALKRGP